MGKSDAQLPRWSNTMNAEERKALGEKVEAARKAQRYTQQQLADLAGVSLGVISNLERGETVPQSGNRRAIAKALGEDIFGEATAQAARDLWPTDVQIFTDVLGGYLARLDPVARARQVAEWMSEIVNSRPNG
jgi:transcriptional regulator with XRE-family HTH domain